MDYYIFQQPVQTGLGLRKTRVFLLYIILKGKCDEESGSKSVRVTVGTNLMLAILLTLVMAEHNPHILFT